MSSLWRVMRFRRDHRWTPPHVSGYLDADLSTRGRARVERHVAQCPECRRLFDDLRHLLGLLQGAPAPAPAADVAAIASGVQQRLHGPAAY